MSLSTRQHHGYSSPWKVAPFPSYQSLTLPLTPACGCLGPSLSLTVVLRFHNAKESLVYNGKRGAQSFKTPEDKAGSGGAPLYSGTQQAEASLLYTVRPCLKNQTNKQKKARA